MVHALSRARTLLMPTGIVVDVHPTTAAAYLELVNGTDFLRLADRLDDGSPTGPLRRHAAADRAIDECAAAGVLRRVADAAFTFHTFADSVDELLAYLAVKWKTLQFAEADLRRARASLERTPGAALVVTERVIASKLSVPR